MRAEGAATSLDVSLDFYPALSAKSGANALFGVLPCIMTRLLVMSISLPKITGISVRFPEAVDTHGHTAPARLLLKGYKSLHNRYLDEHQRRHEEIGCTVFQANWF